MHATLQDSVAVVAASTRAPSSEAAPQDSPSQIRRPIRRLFRVVGALGLVVVLALVIARLLLPGFLHDYVARVLDQSPQYDGRIGGIDVHLWRGAYSIHDLNIVKTTNAVPVPLVECPQVDLAIDWSSLLHRRLRGRVLMDRPKLHFVDGPSDEQSQTGVDQPWLGMLKDLFPFRIDKAQINDGQVHFHAFHTQPPVDISISELQATLTNLTNVTQSLDPLIASVHASGVAMGTGRFTFDMSLDPQSHRPAFNLAAQLLDLDVRELNALTLAYGDFDFEEGEFDLVIELSTKDGFLDGYAKPLFRNLKVIGPRDLETNDPFQIFWEALVGIVGEIFQNQPREQFGTRLTLQGEYDNPQTSILEIIGNVLHNAFVRAYLPRFEGRTAPDVVPQNQRHQKTSDTPRQGDTS
jgi:hypothetical protein